MTIKLIFALVAAALDLAYYPYIRDLFKGKTKPHLYTWLVWALTQGTAAVGLWYGGGRLGVLSLVIGTALVIVIFLLSFKYGTKNITRADTIVLLAALLAIVLWWRLDNPYLAVFMVSLIDGLGYVPTFRKSFQAPWSETLSFWIAMMFAALFALLANAEYNFLTVTYLATCAVANAAVILILVFRRRQVPQSVSAE
jgi:hypothetical protein